MAPNSLQPLDPRELQRFNEALNKISKITKKVIDPTANSLLNLFESDVFAEKNKETVEGLSTIVEHMDRLKKTYGTKKTPPKYFATIDKDIALATERLENLEQIL
jgi:hypothetical protein